MSKQIGSKAKAKIKTKSIPISKFNDQPKTAPWVILCLILDILAVGLIPLNLCLTELPEWITIVFSVLIGSATGILWAKNSRFKAGKAALSLLNAVAMVITLFGAYCNPYWNNLLFRANVDFYSKPYNETLSGKQAKSDLDYAVKYLQKCHPALIDGLTEEIEEKYKETAEELLHTDSITINALSGKIERIFAMLGDGHTYAADNCKRRYLKYTYSHEQAEEELTAVNGASIEELFEKNRGLYSFEAESYGYVQLRNDLESLEGLDYLGINVKDGAVFTYKTLDGEQIDFTYYENDFVPYDEYLVYNGIESESSEDESFVRYEIDKDKSLAVLTLDSCNYNDEYISCVREMFTEVKNGGIENVCVDLRSNSGGNSLVANEFIKYLPVKSYKDIGMSWRLGFLNLSFDGGESENPQYDELIFEGDVYVLTSYYTFSSAMDFTQYIIDNELGTVIGEPCGNSPNSCGEITVFKCPDSGIAFQVSTKRWRRIDREKTELLLSPDIECKADKALDKLYEILDL